MPDTHRPTDFADALGAVGVELLQVPDPGGAVEAHLLLEREVGLQLWRELAGEAGGVHDCVLSGTSRTHSSRRSWSTLRYRSVDSGFAWPSTAEMVGRGPTRAAAGLRRCGAAGECQ